MKVIEYNAMHSLCVARHHSYVLVHPSRLDNEFTFIVYTGDVLTFHKLKFIFAHDESM